MSINGARFYASHRIRERTDCDTIFDLDTLKGYGTYRLISLSSSVADPKIFISAPDPGANLISAPRLSATALNPPLFSRSDTVTPKLQDFPEVALLLVTVKREEVLSYAQSHDLEMWVAKHAASDGDDAELLQHQVCVYSLLSAHPPQLLSYGEHMNQVTRRILI